ncbi:MAG: hypothetical protein HC904_12090 [Blastochloris sp.]|nr:hypothetical protein [Blastochloris sp.]
MVEHEDVNAFLDTFLSPSKDGAESELRRDKQFVFVNRCRVVLAFSVSALALFAPSREILACALSYLLASLALQWASPWLKKNPLRHLPLLVDAAALVAYTLIRRAWDHPLENIMTYTTGGTVMILGASLLLHRRAILLAICLVGFSYLALFMIFFGTHRFPMVRRF